MLICHIVLFEAPGKKITYLLAYFHNDQNKKKKKLFPLFAAVVGCDGYLIWIEEGTSEHKRMTHVTHVFQGGSL